MNFGCTCENTGFVATYVLDLMMFIRFLSNQLNREETLDDSESPFSAVFVFEPVSVVQLSSMDA